MYLPFQIPNARLKRRREHVGTKPHVSKTVFILLQILAEQSSNWLEKKRNKNKKKEKIYSRRDLEFLRVTRQIPVIGLENIPRACVSSTHLISNPFFL